MTDPYDLVPLALIAIGLAALVDLAGVTLWRKVFWR